MSVAQNAARPDAPAAEVEGITLLQAVTEALHEEMARDPRVVLLGQDVGRKGGVFKATVGLQAEYGPLRVLAGSSGALVSPIPTFSAVTLLEAGHEGKAATGVVIKAVRARAGAGTDGRRIAAAVQAALAG